MSVSLAFALMLAPAGQTIKVPIYNADQKNPAVVDYAVTVLPAGFKDVKFGSGKITSSDGSITMSVLRSATDMPSLLRNSKAKKDDDFTTIRLTNWIGYRNSRKGGEDYKLNHQRYRINFSVDYKDKAGLPKLREAIHALVDALNVKPNG